MCVCVVCKCEGGMREGYGGGVGVGGVREKRIKFHRHVFPCSSAILAVSHFKKKQTMRQVSCHQCTIDYWYLLILKATITTAADKILIFFSE